jgi:hypothetical protein
MTAVLLTTLFLGSDGFPVMPLTIVAVVVAYVAGNWLAPVPTRRASGIDEDPGHRTSDLPTPRAGEPQQQHPGLDVGHVQGKPHRTVAHERDSAGQVGQFISPES